MNLGKLLSDIVAVDAKREQINQNTEETNQE